MVVCHMKSRWRHSETTIFGQSWAGARSAGMFLHRNCCKLHTDVCTQKRFDTWGLHTTSTHWRIWVVTHKCFYAQKKRDSTWELLRTEMLTHKVFHRGAIIFKINSNKICSCTAACTHKCFYEQLFTPHFFCTDRLFCAHVFVLTSACAHSDTEAILRTQVFYAQKLYTRHPDVLTCEASPRRQTQCFYPQKLLHRGAFAHRSF